MKKSFITSGPADMGLHHENMSVKLYPLEPHFYVANLGYAEVYLLFLFLLQNIHVYCGYSLEPAEAVLTCTHYLSFEQK